MSERRPLGEMLSEITANTLDELKHLEIVKVRRIEVALPVEMGIRQQGDAIQFFGDVPRLLTRTPFDLKPGRVEVVWEAEELP